MSALRAPVLAFVVAGVVPWAVSAAEPDPEVAYAERALKEDGLPTDGASLLAFFRMRTLSTADQERLTRAVHHLGDEKFAVREQASRDLILAGRGALPFLRTGLTDPDPEIVRRARDCIDGIEQRPATALTTAAARLLAYRRPVGADEVLLAYLPCADEEAIEEAVFAALVQVGLAGGKPGAAVVAALEDRNALRRAAAAQVVGLAAAGERRAAVRLLTDSDPRVRFEAAAALVRAGDRAAVPSLIHLLSDCPVKLAWRAEDLLARLAGDQRPDVTLGAGEFSERRKCQEAWEGWWLLHADRVDLTRLQGEEMPLGLTLICEYDGGGGGRVWECGKDGKPRWQVSGLQGPNDAQLLPGGRILIAERNGARVTERDRQGKVLWQHSVPGSPIACQRLPNGNTLIATFTELLEVAPDGKKVAGQTHPAGFRHAMRMRNGHIVFVASNGQVVELDAAWKPVRSVTPASHGQGAGYWASVEPLPGGHFLLALGGVNRVIEMNAAGKIVWECAMTSAVYATRLHNGHTLIACFEGRALVEVDRAGKEVGRQALPGRPFTVRRY
jgi:hypothetical protein